MKKYIAIALVLVLTVCLFAGCRRSQEDTAGESTAMPGTTENSMLPDGGDTIDPTNGDDMVDPTNGANRDPGSSEETQSTNGADPMPTDNAGDNSRRHGRAFPGR